MNYMNGGDYGMVGQQGMTQEDIMQRSMMGQMDQQQMMGHMGQQPYGPQGVAPFNGMYGPPCPPAGYVSLDPECAPGAVTLDPGNPCYPQMPYHYEDCNRHHAHHKHHCPCPEPAPMPEPQPRTYVVRSGDSVYLIAKRFGTTMQAIILANNLQNPDLIFPGQVLYIPNVPDMNGMRG